MDALYRGPMAAGERIGSTGGGTPVLRRINTAVVLEALRDAGSPLRIAELVQRTGLARPTVAQVVEDLSAAGWLVQHEPDPEEQTMGRPAIRVSLDGRAAPVVGLDIGPHSVTVGVCDLTGVTLSMVRRPGVGPAPAKVLPLITEVVRAGLDAAGVPAADVGAIAVATPGLVDDGRIRLAPSLPGWNAVDLPAHLRRTVDCPVLLDNDANMAALAVSNNRGGAETVIAVQWGERIGGGVVINGRLHRGASAAAGEVGFIRPRTATSTSPEELGPLEQAIGTEKIAEMGRRAAAEHPDSVLAREEIDAAHVFAAAKQGDAAAKHIVDEVTEAFADALAPVVLVLDPEAVVIGGGIARAGDVLVEAVSRHLYERTLTQPVVELSPLAEDTVVTGAMLLALEDVWLNRLPTKPLNGLRG
jgi:predicted NBD/HSP70 family sugar kinase